MLNFIILNKLQIIFWIWLEAHISKIKKYSIIQLFKINKYINKHNNNNKDSITQKTLKKIKKQHSNKIQESKLRIKIRTTILRI